jgi:hypothetical protein
MTYESEESNRKYWLMKRSETINGEIMAESVA